MILDVTVIGALVGVWLLVMIAHSATVRRRRDSEAAREERQRLREANWKEAMSKKNVE